MSRLATIRDATEHPMTVPMELPIAEVASYLELVSVVWILTSHEKHNSRGVGRIFSPSGNHIRRRPDGLKVRPTRRRLRQALKAS